ncbi:MAG: transcriptional regulator, family [Actinomycetia bacterium]|nr:transcriptional regulator, family [Actinomycetes bacterium]
MATWVRADGIWHVDTTDRKPTLREFTDAAGHASSASITEAASPAERLVLLADYLGLDIGWLARRCRALARVGWDDLARPHSRLLSLEGLHTACAYVGRLAVPSRLAG